MTGGTPGATHPRATTVEACILTYRRPATLAVSVPLVLAQLDEWHLSSGDATRLLVIDNDPDASARDYVEGLADPRIVYVHEPRPGIAAARQRALTASREVDLMAFIDDDEHPEPGWLASLIRTWAVSEPAAVMGRVVSTFPEDLDPWVAAGGFFIRRRMPTGTEIEVAAAGNLLLDLRQIRALGVGFDPRLGLSGGEDTLFSHHLRRAGGRIVWCEESVAQDPVPADRMTRAWALRRSFSHGNTMARVELMLADSPAARFRVRLRHVLRGSLRMVAGALRATVGTLRRSLRDQARGMRTLHRGRGMLVGGLGVMKDEYARG